jgi:hypothetical protein
MGKISYKSLYQYVNETVDKKITSSKDSASSVSSDSSIRITSSALNSDVTLSELVASIHNMLADTMTPNIISGLDVSATVPISNSIIVNSGSGTVGGVLYTLEEPYTLTINFDDTTSVYYIVLYKDSIQLDRVYSSNKLTVAKIVIPNPGTTSLIQDEKDESWNAYIVNFSEYKLYGHNDKFEEDTIELLRNNISPILADNLIGNIRLNEDLKIINTAGTLELDSNSLKLYDVDEHLLAKFNQNGTYFYDESGIEMARFTNVDSRIGNILINTDSIQSGNYVTGVSGFKIQDSGDVEFSDGTFRGTLYATVGNIGGWTIGSNKIYATTTGTIQTSATVGVGSNGVILDKDGLRVYDSVLGNVVNLPSDGSAPTFSSGTINESTFEISTNSVLRTSSTVGDGSSSSAGILINNTGIYGCKENQLLQSANFKILATGDAYFKGEIQAESGTIGSVTITPSGLYGGLIEGALIRAPIIESSATYPKVRLDDEGFHYTVSGGTGLYGEFLYGEGTYGAGTLAYLFSTNFPILSIEAETVLADIHLYNRTDVPGDGTGPHRIGDIICVDGEMRMCITGGSPGTFTTLISSSGTTGGTGSAGAGKQYIIMMINGINYKILHDGTV